MGTLFVRDWRAISQSRVEDLEATWSSDGKQLVLRESAEQQRCERDKVSLWWWFSQW